MEEKIQMELKIEPKCPKCNGTGKVDYDDLVCTCPECDGSGI